MSWAPVAHTCNPTYSGGREIRRIEVQSQPGKIVHEPLLENIHHKKDWQSDSNGKVPAQQA
jgi:hypothetical protein